eukprot:gb/GEZN01000553.1/.p1 GENE.gb/GEZN01000553.1/~~gb/GEZN01000553.1/.p1  ORF type:complete len:1253 (+),score=357.41 gb/GEZN01000553.1/:273-3761(+)
MFIRIYNYNTMERVHQFEAHTDYIRSLAIHPTLPYVLSSSDDMFIKLWDWDKEWNCQQVFEGHGHYVMQVCFNPKDSNTFASASLDRTVKVWGLNASVPHFSLEGHERGVNCVGYFRGGDRPYLVSGADDFTVKVWDYQTKACVATMEGHTGNVSAVCFHPQLPIILSGAEDGTVRVWHSSTYRLENTLTYGMERVWSVEALPGSNRVAIGYDDGTVMVKLGQEEPVASMEPGGKVTWAKNQVIHLANLKTLKRGENKQVDGEMVSVDSKELGSVEIYPQTISHDPRGRYVCVCGDGEFTIYTAIKLSNKAFGSGMEFVWGSDTGSYATRVSGSKIQLYKDWKESKSLKCKFTAEGMFGGRLLAVRSAEFIVMYDWETLNIIRRIDVCPRKVYWSDLGTVVLACDTDFFVLRYHADLVQKFMDQGVEIPDKGIERAFEVTGQISQRVRTGYFVGDCFIFTNSQGRLCYYVGGEIVTLAHLPKTLYLLGYLDRMDRVYLIDKDHQIYSYELLMSVLLYQMAIVRGEHEQAVERLKKIPAEQHNKLARFLEAQGLLEMALDVSQDPEHRFELAMQCKKLQLAREILGDSESEHKWKQLGDVALNQAFDLKLAVESYSRAKDLGSLLLIHSSLGDAQGMLTLAKMAEEGSSINIAFICYFLLNRVADCSRVLVDTGRVAEAAFLTRTYAPSNIDSILKLWKDDLRKVSEKAADALASPSAYPDLFPDLPDGVKQQKWAQEHLYDNLLPASSYLQQANRSIRGLGDGSMSDDSSAAAVSAAQPDSAPEAAGEEEDEDYDEERERAEAEAEAAALAKEEATRQAEENRKKQEQKQKEEAQRQKEEAQKQKQKEEKEKARLEKEAEQLAGKEEAAKLKKEKEEAKRLKKEQAKKEKDEAKKLKEEQKKKEAAEKKKMEEEIAMKKKQEEEEREAAARRLREAEEEEQRKREEEERLAEEAQIAADEEEIRRAAEAAKKAKEEEAAAAEAAAVEAAAREEEEGEELKQPAREAGGSKKERAAADKAKREQQRKERELKRKQEREKKRKEKEAAAKAGPAVPLAVEGGEEEIEDAVVVEAGEGEEADMVPAPSGGSQKSKSKKKKKKSKEPEADPEKESTDVLLGEEVAVADGEVSEAIPDLSALDKELNDLAGEVAGGDDMDDDEWGGF